VGFEPTIRFSKNALKCRGNFDRAESGHLRILPDKGANGGGAPSTAASYQSGSLERDARQSFHPMVVLWLSKIFTRRTREIGLMTSSPIRLRASCEEVIQPK
jgi:hypothetical protein